MDVPHGTSGLGGKPVQEGFRRSGPGRRVRAEYSFFCLGSSVSFGPAETDGVPVACGVALEGQGFRGYGYIRTWLGRSLGWEGACQP